MLKVALLPGQLVRFEGPTAVVSMFTVSVAQLVTLLQAPLTTTQYVPVSALPTDAIA